MALIKRVTVPARAIFPGGWLARFEQTVARIRKQRREGRSPGEQA